jgi:transposase
MPASRSSTPPMTWKEGRRFRALELQRQGWSNVEIAEALGVSPAAVCQWLTTAATQGERGLQARSRQGQGRRLSPEQLRRLPSLLEQGAEAHGFLGALWTCRRIGVVIEREFGVSYHRGYVSRLMHQLKWTYQKPLLRTSQRNEEQIARWLSCDWPALRLRAQNEGRTLVFVDEAGFSLRPSVNKTWSPAGCSPLVSAPLLRDHLSVIGGLTWEGHLFTQIHHTTINAKAAIDFLRHLLRYLPGPLLMLWDGARIHRSRELAVFRQLDTQQRLVIEHFPAYAPEVDPQEYVWQHLKHVDLRNLTSQSLDQLWARLQDATNRLRGRVGLLKNLVRHAGLGN